MFKARSISEKPDKSSKLSGTTDFLRSLQTIVNDLFEQDATPNGLPLSEVTLSVESMPKETSA